MPRRRLKGKCDARIPFESGWLDSGAPRADAPLPQAEACQFKRLPPARRSRSGARSAAQQAEPGSARVALSSGQLLTPLLLLRRPPSLPPSAASSPAIASPVAVASLVGMHKCACAQPATQATEMDLDKEFSEWTSVQRGEELLRRFYVLDDAARAVQTRFRQRRALHGHVKLSSGASSSAIGFVKRISERAPSFARQHSSEATQAALEALHAHRVKSGRIDSVGDGEAEPPDSSRQSTRREARLTGGAAADVLNRASGFW